MATLDFPTATPGGTYTGGNGVTYTYDGTAGVWTAAASGGGGSFLPLAGGTMTGAIVNAAGTAAAPSLSFTGDLDTGFYSPGAGIVGISNNGTGNVFVDASGRLLIGTSTSMSAGAQAQFAKFQIIGSTASATGQGIISIGRGQAASGAIGANTDIGYINFTDNAGNEFAQIGCLTDATTGSSDYPGRLSFSTTPSGSATPVERMRIDSAGTSYFLSTANTIGALTTVGAGTSTRLYYGSHTATGIGGTISYTVWSNGNVVNTNNSYAAISDVKLKENIVDAGSQWDDIKGLRVCNYNLKEGQTHRQIGLVAQEVETISPGLVFESPDRDDEGNDLGTVTKSVNYSVLYMKAVKALQEAMERIEQLEARIEAAGI